MFSVIGYFLNGTLPFSVLHSTTQNDNENKMFILILKKRYIKDKYVWMCKTISADKNYIFDACMWNIFFQN